MTRRGLLDTSVVIGLGRVDDPGALPDECLISTVTLAELSVGPLVAAEPRERAVRQQHLQLAEATFRPLPFDDAAARAFGRIAADLRRDGRTRRARAFDALIAATAISQGLPVFTANPDDFEGIDELEVHPVTV